MFAKDRYFELKQAYKRKDKVLLMRILSIPLYDVIEKKLLSIFKVFRDSIKKKRELPFVFYNTIVDVKLVQGISLLNYFLARIFAANKIGGNPKTTWH